jgi:hypothetical protein
VPGTPPSQLGRPLRYPYTNTQTTLKICKK